MVKFFLQEGSRNGKLQEFHKLSTLIKRAGVKSMATAIQFIVKVCNSLKPFDVVSTPHKLSTAWNHADLFAVKSEAKDPKLIDEGPTKDVTIKKIRIKIQTYINSKVISI